MSIHIGAKQEEVAETVLLTGDPLRAQHIAEHYLENARCVNHIRNMLCFTGEYQSKQVSVLSVGMGMPSMAIYVNELINEFGVKTLIRLGTAGALQPHILVGDIVLAMAACTDSNMNEKIFDKIDFAPIADYGLLKRSDEIFQGRAHVGSVLTTDVFYEEVSTRRGTLIEHGVLAVEMETAALYTLAMRHQVKALSILKISDHIITGESTPSDVREKAFIDMAESVLPILE